MNKLIMVLFAVNLLSCNNGVKNNLSSLYSSHIVIPNTFVSTFNGKDTILDYVYNSKLKFIIYADSSNCTSCNINKMYMWDKLLRYVKTNNERLEFYFIFATSSHNFVLVKDIIALNPIDYPTFIDTLGDFEKLNPHLPKNKAMHTFLLDENNKVILVGNPLYNKEIEKLFYKITQEKLSK